MKFPVIFLSHIAHAFISQNILKGEIRSKQCILLNLSENENENYIDQDGSIKTNVNLREFRARLVAMGLNYGEQDATPDIACPTLEYMNSSNPTVSSSRWAHELSAIEQGCILIAKEGSFESSQPYFRNAVILIIEHNHAGTVGLILNQPTSYKMEDLVGRDTGLKELPGLELNILYMGGDVGSNRNDGLDVVNLMHGREDIPGTEVIKGIKLGGLKQALEKIADGSAQSHEFKFFSRYCGWAPNQLSEELSWGAWYLAACDLGTILQSHIEQQPDRLWTDILQRMGGKYARIADCWGISKS